MKTKPNTNAANIEKWVSALLKVCGLNGLCGAGDIAIKLPEAGGKGFTIMAADFGDLLQPGLLFDQPTALFLVPVQRGA